MTKQLEDLEEELRKRWPGDPAGELCIKLLEYMREQPEGKLRMMTFYTIGAALGRKPLDEDVLRAVTILVSSKVHALEKRLLFIDEDYEDIEVPNEEIEEAQRSGQFVHPWTGEVVEDYESKLVPFFVPSEEFLRLKASQDG